MVEADLRKNKGDLLREINPEMSPIEVIARINRFNELDFNETHSPVIAARKELLVASGNNPEDWIFYTNHAHVRKDLSVGEELDNFYSRYFPPRIEFLAIKGNFIGGAYKGEFFSASVKYIFDPNGYTVFVKVKPDMLPEKTEIEEN